MHVNKLKDRPGTDQTLKLVSYNSYKEIVTKQESTAFNVVLVHINSCLYSRKFNSFTN